jgi:hypothetical protein
MSSINENPKIINETDKPIETDYNQNQKVDINVLKARAKAIQDKENLKNSVLIILSLIVICVTGFYFSI